MNSRNTVYWGSNASDRVLTKPLHSEKVTAWIAMRREGGLIGPFFFEDERGKWLVALTSAGAHPGFSGGGGPD